MARAIVRRPRVLLLDEPLSALDVKLREGMQVELKRLHRELGITFVMVTHDQTEALALSDRIVVMNQGRIAQIGSPTELYDNPSTPYVADFIGAANLIEAKAAGRDGDFAAFRLGSTVIRSARTASSAIVDRATLGIRPERFLVSGSEDANTLAFTIKEILFHGDRLRLELTMDGVDKPLFTELPRTALPGSGSIGTGSAITLHVEPSDILVFTGGVAG